jgi:hypothetical protein
MGGVSSGYSVLWADWNIKGLFLTGRIGFPLDGESYKKYSVLRSVIVIVSVIVISTWASQQWNPNGGRQLPFLS